jgi:hypothetical protein
MREREREKEGKRERKLQIGQAVQSRETSNTDVRYWVFSHSQLCQAPKFIEKPNIDGCESVVVHSP